MTAVSRIQDVLNGAALSCLLIAGMAYQAGDTAICLALVAASTAPVLFFTALRP